MKNRVMLLAVWLVAIFALTGCRATEADISPDGKTVAYTTEKGLLIGPAKGGAGKLVLKGECAPPVFSPDGRFVATQTTSPKPATWLVDAKLRTPRKVGADLGPPFAWRPDSKELLGWPAPNRAAVMDVRTGRIVRQMPIERPEKVVWIGAKALGLAYSERVVYWRPGAIRTVASMLKDVQSIGGDERRLVWTESSTPDADGIPSARTAVQTLELESGRVQTLRETNWPTEFLESGNELYPSGLAVSPDGTRLAFAGFESLTTSDLTEKLLAAERRRQKEPNNPALEEEVNDLAAKVRIRVNSGLVGLDRGEKRVLARSGAFSLGPPPAPKAERKRRRAAWEKEIERLIPIGVPHEVRWSKDGRTVLIVGVNGCQALPVQ